MSDSENFHFIHNLFVYDTISTTDSSKCLYLGELKAYINRIFTLGKNGLSESI